MGIYINPLDMPKDQWLRENGKIVSTEYVRMFDEWDSDDVIICLVDNVGFTAGLVMKDKREQDAVLDPKDDRSKTFFLVSKKKVESVTRGWPIRDYNPDAIKLERMQ